VIPELHLGMLVSYRIVKDIGGTKYISDYPGIVYKIVDASTGVIAFTLFQDGVPTRYGHVYYSEEKKEGHWSGLK
jgi:hypothetical protein